MSMSLDFHTFLPRTSGPKTKTKPKQEDMKMRCVLEGTMGKA